MNILFLVIGPVPLKSANFVRNFIKQLDTQEHSICVMAERVTLALLQTPQRTKTFLLDNDFTENIFKEILDKNRFDFIIIGNFEILLYDDSNILFKKNHFSLIKTPIMFLLATGSSLIFRDGHCIFSENDNKIKINAPFSVIKPCPPFIPDMDNDENNKNVKTFYWKNLETFAFLNKEEARASIKQRIKASEESKIVSLMLDNEQTIPAGIQKLSYHYKVLIDCISYYLSKLDTDINLIVGNMTRFTLENEYPNVKVIFWGTVLDEDQEQIIRGSDLILTESISGTVLVDSANLKIPVINLKSTVIVEKIIDEENQEFMDIMFNFPELTEFGQSKIEELISNCPESIFPYYSFPNVASVKFDETKVFGLYIFTFTELFDEKGTIQLLNDLLLSPDAIKEETYRINQYLALRADAEDAEEILGNYQ